MSYWKFTKMLVTLYTYHDRSFKTLMLNKLIMNIIFKSKLSELEDETLISSIISEWAVPLRETEVADSHRKSSVWPLQFGLSLSPLLLTEENPQSPDSNGFQTALRVDKYCVVRYCSTRCGAGKPEKTACPEHNHGQPEPAPVTTWASRGSAKDLPLERYWVYCYCSGWIFRGLVKKAESGSSHVWSS